MKVIRSGRLCDRSQHHLGFAQMAGHAVAREDLAHLPRLLRPAREGVGAAGVELRFDLRRRRHAGVRQNVAGKLRSSETSSWLKCPASTVHPFTTFGSHSDIKCGRLRGGIAARCRAGTLHNAAAVRPSNSRVPRKALAARSVRAANIVLPPSVGLKLYAGWRSPGLVLTMAR